jgi:hypothetical protein
MSWLQIVLLILQLLKNLKSSSSADAFVESMQANGSSLANGDLLRWLWENREKIIKIVLELIDQITKNPPATTLDDSETTDAIAAAITDLRS